MHIYVPKKFINCFRYSSSMRPGYGFPEETNVPYKPSAFPTLGSQLFSCFGSELEELEVDDDSVFYCTKGRIMNDVYHSKPITYRSRSGQRGLLIVDSPVRQYYCFDNTLLYTAGVGFSAIFNEAYDNCWTITSEIAANTSEVYFVVSFAHAYYDVNTNQYYYSSAQVTTYRINRSTRARSYTGSSQFVDAIKGFVDLDHLLDLRIESDERYRVHQAHFTQNFLSSIEQVVKRFTFSYTVKSLTSSWVNVTATMKPLISSFPSDMTRFLLNEPHHLVHQDSIYADLGIYGAFRDNGLYAINKLKQDSYLDALDNVPRMNDNNITNIIELVGFIKSLVIDHRIEIPKSLQDIWLSYRYVYTTTKLDAEEAISFVHRHMDLGGLDKGLTSYGQSSLIIKDDVLARCRCRFDIVPKEVGTLAKIWRALYTYGLQPNFYVVWDMTPYSFIVDWFLPIGDLAHMYDIKNEYNGTNYDISNICFSIEYVQETPVGSYKQYTRWASGSPPELSAYYALDRSGPSNKVVGFRVLDTLSLFIK